MRIIFKYAVTQGRQRVLVAVWRTRFWALRAGIGGIIPLCLLKLEGRVLRLRSIFFRSACLASATLSVRSG